VSLRVRRGEGFLVEGFVEGFEEGAIDEFLFVRTTNGIVEEGRAWMG
jgi:hypothetical protein